MVKFEHQNIYLLSWFLYYLILKFLLAKAAHDQMKISVNTRAAKTHILLSLPQTALEGDLHNPPMKSPAETLAENRLLHALAAQSYFGSATYQQCVLVWVT